MARRPRRNESAIAHELRIDRAENVAQALSIYQSGKADFVDALIERVSHDAGCTAVRSTVAGTMSMDLTL